MFSLKGKNTLITGGSRGIGAAIVKTFVEYGAHVAFTYRSSKEEAEQLIQSLGKTEGKVIAFSSDASSFEAANQLVSEVVKELGGIDILINNAGITKDTLLLRMTEDQWDQVIEVNLKSVFNLTKHSIRPMMKSGGGSIINISSVVGVTGNAGQSNYAASKAGIFGFTKSIAKEMGSRNIRCNAIAPGFIETEMTDELNEETKMAYLANIPLKRLGKAQEVADLCAYLATDNASFISGQTISICGAMTT
jgi:3-oxoacyl-[acyl-carrier protein] reductase